MDIKQISNEIYKARREAIRKADEIKMKRALAAFNSKDKPNKLAIVGAILLLSVLIGALMFLMMHSLYPQQKIVEIRTIEKQPIINNNNYREETKYNNTVNNVIVPKDSANCIKVFSKDNPDNFVLNCEKV